VIIVLVLSSKNLNFKTWRGLNKMGTLIPIGIIVSGLSGKGGICPSDIFSRRQSLGQIFTPYPDIAIVQIFESSKCILIPL